MIAKVMDKKTIDDPVERGGVIVQFAPPRLPFHPAIEERFGIDKGAWKALVEAVFPGAKTIDAVAMVLSYCKARNLDPFKKPVHIVPMWSTAANGYVETVWPGIAELRTTAFRTGQYAGCDETEFGPEITQTFTGKVDEWKDRQKRTVDKTIELTFPDWCRITLYREVHGKICKFVGPKVKWLENYATIGKTDLPNEMWQSRPEGQLEKCAEAAALRKTFPEEIGGDLTAEEMEGKVMNDAASLARDVTPPALKPPAPPPAPEVLAPPPAAGKPPAPPAAPEKPKANRKQRQHEAAKAAADRAEGIPEAGTNPAAFLKWADDLLFTVGKADDLEETFNSRIEPRAEGMFPPDRDELAGIYRKHEKRLGGD